MTITPQLRREFVLEDIPRSVRASGFVPADMFLRARGSVEVREGQRRFRIRHWSRTYPLVGSPQDVTDEIELYARVEYTSAKVMLHVIERDSDVKLRR